MSDPVALTHVVPVFNKIEALPATWAALRDQDFDGAREVLFLDDGSTDGSLDYLRRIAAEDARVRVIADGENSGPGARINQGAAAARGRWLHFIDADDLAPPDTARFILREAARLGADVVHGRRRAGAVAALIGAEIEAALVPDALLFAAERKPVHMALGAERTLFLASGGAVAGVFCQDQVLAHRLALAGARLAWTEAVLAWAPPAAKPGASANRVQQNVDRLANLGEVLAATPAGHPAERAMLAECVASVWKARRDAGGGLAWASRAHLDYLAAKLGLWRPTRADLPRLRAATAFALPHLGWAPRPGADRPERLISRDN